MIEDAFLPSAHGRPSTLAFPKVVEKRV